MIPGNGSQAAGSGNGNPSESRAPPNSSAVAMASYPLRPPIGTLGSNTNALAYGRNPFATFVTPPWNITNHFHGGNLNVLQFQQGGRYDITIREGPPQNLSVNPGPSPGPSTGEVATTGRNRQLVLTSNGQTTGGRGRVAGTAASANAIDRRARPSNRNQSRSGAAASAVYIPMEVEYSDTEETSEVEPQA